MDPEILKQLKTLHLKTQENKINWKQINQNSIRWTSHANGNMYITTLQSIATGRILNGLEINQYILTIQSNTGEMILQVQSNSDINPEYSPILKDLFDYAITKSKADSLTILNQLLNNS